MTIIGSFFACYELMQQTLRFVVVKFTYLSGYGLREEKTGLFNCFGSGWEVRQLNVPVRVWCYCAVGLPRAGRM